MPHYYESSGTGKRRSLGFQFNVSAKSLGPFLTAFMRISDLAFRALELVENGFVA